MDGRPLSPREKEVMTLLALGLTPREIRERLFISEKTYDSHCYNICIKLGLSNFFQLRAYAAREGR